MVTPAHGHVNTVGLFGPLPEENRSEAALTEYLTKPLRRLAGKSGWTLRHLAHKTIIAHYKPDAVVFLDGLAVPEDALFFIELKVEEVFSAKSKGQIMNTALALMKAQPERASGGEGRVYACLMNFTGVAFFEFTFKPVLLDGKTDYAFVGGLETGTFAYAKDGAEWLHVMLHASLPSLGCAHMLAPGHA